MPHPQRQAEGTCLLSGATKRYVDAGTDPTPEPGDVLTVALQVHAPVKGGSAALSRESARGTSFLSVVCLSPPPE